MKHYFYRFHIEQKRGRYRLKIGDITDQGNTGWYCYVDMTYFGILCPEAGATHFNATSANEALTKLRELLISHPLYRKPL